MQASPIEEAPPSAPTEVIGPRRARHSAIAYGVPLALTLLAFRIEKVLSLDPGVSTLDWVKLLAPELGFVLLLESIWVGVSALLGPRRDRLLRTGFLVLHLLLYAALLVEHQFFLETGAILRLGVFVYTLRNISDVHGVVSTGANTTFLVRAALVLLSMALAWRLDPGAHWTRRRAGLSRRLLGPGGAALGILILLYARPDPQRFPFTSSALVDLSLPTGPRALTQLASLDRHEFYSSPRTTSPVLQRKPDVVLLILESTRSDVLRDPDRPGEHASFLDDLASRSVVFKNTYVGVAHTSKALVALLCGMYPSMQMQIVESSPDPLPLKCMPHLLRELGYRTKFMQTAKGDFENRHQLLENVGFEAWRTREHLTAPGFEKVGYFGLDEFAMLKPAVDWLAESEQPALLTLLTVTTHHPYQIPGHPPPDKRDDAYPHYRKAVEHVDRFVEAFYEELRNRGRLDDTVLIVVSDHGEAFGEHGLMQHDSVPYEEVVRVPLMLHGPQWLGHARSDSGLRHQVDLLPTVLELLGASWEGTLPGRSLLSSDGHPHVVSSCWYEEYCLSMRQGALKFVYHYGRRPTEVFDLQSDPGERRDIAARLPREQLERAEEQMLRTRYASDLVYGVFPGR